jgi:hypothetical protein
VKHAEAIEAAAGPLPEWVGTVRVRRSGIVFVKHYRLWDFIEYTAGPWVVVKDDADGFWTIYDRDRRCCGGAFGLEKARWKLTWRFFRLLAGPDLTSDMAAVFEQSHKLRDWTPLRVLADMLGDADRAEAEARLRKYLPK